MWRRRRIESPPAVTPQVPFEWGATNRVEEFQRRVIEANERDLKYRRRLQRRDRRHTAWMLSGTTLTLSVLAYGLIWLANDPMVTVESGDMLVFPTSGFEHPPEPPDASDTPLGTAPTPLVQGSFRFIERQSDETNPVAWDPCRPIHYVVNHRLEPAGGAEALSEGLRRLTFATGLKFVNDGDTDEAPSYSRQPYQPDRYGDRWAPVLIAWTDDAEVPDLRGSVVGLAGSLSVSERGTTRAGRVYVTGQVNFDGPQLDTVFEERRGEDTVLAVVQHELGHLLGLDHVNDETQIMNPQATGEISDFGDGDIQGLAYLGKGECYPDV